MKIEVVGAGLAGLLSTKWIKEKTGADVRVFERQSRENYDVSCANGFIDTRGYMREVRDSAEKFFTKEINESVWRFYLDGGQRDCKMYYNDYFYTIDRGAWQKHLVSECENND